MKKVRKAASKHDSSKWKLFERLVAAIHHAETRGAIVVWNDKINKDQFDVTVRFQYGLYKYLTVIECKDHKRHVVKEKVDAFVTKSGRAKADKGIMVSSNRYQEGCLEIARDRKIELYTLTQLNRIPEEILSSRLTPGLHLRNIVDTFNIYYEA